MSCEGCKLEAIKNKTQQTHTHEEAKQYATENQTNTVVYFDGSQWQFTTEQQAREQQLSNIAALYTP